MVQENQRAQHILQAWDQGKLVDLGSSQLQKLQPTSQAITQIRPTLIKFVQGIETGGLRKKTFATEIEKPARAMLRYNCTGQLRALQWSIATDQKESHSPALATSEKAL